MGRRKGQLHGPHEPLGRVWPYDRCLLYGAAAICAYMGFSQSTLRSWIKHQAFPVAKMPDGRWVTSTQLIDNWIVSRNPYILKLCEQPR